MNSSSSLGQEFSIANSTMSIPSFNLLGSNMGYTVTATNGNLVKTSYTFSGSFLREGSNMSATLAPFPSSDNLTIASTTASTDLLQTPSSSLSCQINPLVMFNSSTCTMLPVSTCLFPTYTTATSVVFSTLAWPTATSSENVTVSDSV